MVDHPGIGRYIKCLLPELIEDRSFDMHILGNKEKIRKYLHTEKKIIDFNYPIYSIQEQLGFLKIKSVIGDDILHIPHYNIPVLAGFNLVATIHDLIHITYPQGASGKLAPIYMKFMIGRIVKSAKAVICVSQATKKEIEKRYKKECLFSVIYEGVNKVFIKIGDQAYLKSVKEKYRLPDKFVLYVGSIRRHKNINGLLDSFERFNQNMPDVQLVMVGRYGQQIDLNRKNVIYLGEIASDADLAGIYNLASCLFNLSLYEGFGLTIVEAQACGLPVVCSDIPVHREIGGDGIISISTNPSYIDQIDKNLYNVISNKSIKESVVLKGFENAKRFNWSVAARQTLELYRKIRDEGSDSSRLVNRHAGRREDT